MQVTETTHHGQFYESREVTLPDPPTRDDVIAMLASCVYTYVNVVPDRLDKVMSDLTTLGKAEHGWTRWDVHL